MRFIAGFVLGAVLSGTLAWGAILPSPPLIKERSIYLYLRKLWNNQNNLTSVTTNPDGSQVGRFGDILFLNDSGTFYIQVCTSQGPEGGTQWRGVVLTNTP